MAINNINNFLKNILKNSLTDGMQLGDSVVVLIDSIHEKMLNSIISKDINIFYELEKTFGIDVHSDEYYEEYYPSTVIQGIHPDHFLLSIKESANKDKIRQLVYKTIEYFYLNRTK